MSQLFLQKMAETFEAEWTAVPDNTPTNARKPGSKTSVTRTIDPNKEAISSFLRRHKKGLIGAGIGAAALGAGAGTAAYLYNRKKKKLQQEQEQAKAALEVIDEFYEKTASKIPVKITSNGRSTKILYKENGEWKKSR